MNIRSVAKILFTAMSISLLLAPSAPAAERKAAATEYSVYVGTYTGKQSQGIYTFTFNAVTAKSAKSMTLPASRAVV